MGKFAHTIPIFVEDISVKKCVYKGVVQMNSCEIQMIALSVCGLMMTACGGGKGAPATFDTQSSSSVNADTLKIEIATDPDGMIRSDIGRQTFGSGIAFNTSQLRWTMDNLANDTTGTPVSSNTSDAIKGLSLGTLRFPNGDSSFQYVAEDPQASYPMLICPNKYDAYQKLV